MPHETLVAARPPAQESRWLAQRGVYVGGIGAYAQKLAVRASVYIEPATEVKHA